MAYTNKISDARFYVRGLANKIRPNTFFLLTVANALNLHNTKAIFIIGVAEIVLIKRILGVKSYV